MHTRTVLKTHEGTPAVDGAGVRLLRVFGHADIQDLDPFLLLDFFDSADPQDYIKGFPWHPHRGIETITYLVEGLLEHGDSLGNRGLIEPLGCQWMTDGSGIIHQEMPQPSARMLGAQLWLNLPRAHKMTQPAYRDITSKDLRIVEDDRVQVKLIAGSYADVKGPVSGTYVDPFYFDITIKPRGRFELRLPAEERVFLLLLEGDVTIPTGDTLEAGRTRGVLLSQGEDIRIDSQNGARLLLMAGKSLNEPVAWGGPIVMNTREEIKTAFEDLDRGAFIEHAPPAEKNSSPGGAAVDRFYTD